IPFLNKKADTNALRKKLGIFSENSVMGFIIGVLLGFAGAYSVSNSLNLGIQVATAMALFPMVSKLFMQALSPLAESMSEFMKKRFNDREVFIGMDWPLLAGRSEVWVTLILMVPFFIGYSLILPGNAVLPIAGVLNYSIAVGGLLLTGGNLARMMILGIIYLPLCLYSATYFAPILTGLANKTGAVEVEAGKLITWSSLESPELRILFAESFNGNILAIGGAVAFLLLFVWLYKTMVTQEVPSKRYEN
ncbi:TPA: PTS transporter subunit IIC, partial [Streptococcus pneumoniae]